MQQKHNVLHSTVGIADNHGQGMSIAVSNQLLPAYPMPTSSSSSSHLVGNHAPRQAPASQPVVPSGQLPKLQTQVDQFFPSQTQVQVSALPLVASSEVIPLRQSSIPSAANYQVKGHNSDNQSSSFGRFVYEVSSESQSNTSEFSSSSSSSALASNKGGATNTVAIVGVNSTTATTITPDAVAEPTGASGLSPECKAKIEMKRQRALALQQANQLKAAVQSLIPVSSYVGANYYPVTSPCRPAPSGVMAVHATLLPPLPLQPIPDTSAPAAAPLSPGTKAKIEASKQRALERLRVTALQRSSIPSASSAPSTALPHNTLPQAHTLPFAPPHPPHTAPIHQPFMNTATSPARCPQNHALHHLNVVVAPINSAYGYNPSPAKPPQHQPQQQHVYHFNTAAGTRIEVTDTGEQV